MGKILFFGDPCCGYAQFLSVDCSNARISAFVVEA
jgi:hypothetical protein